MQPDLHPLSPHLIYQCIHNGFRFIAHRKHPPVVLFLQPDSQILEKGDNVFIVELGKSAVKKPAVSRNILDQLIDLFVIGYITSAAPGDPQLPPELIPFFQ
ncbi:hypothetical protein D3C80_1691000 [compost metagenome]